MHFSCDAARGSSHHALGNHHHQHCWATVDIRLMDRFAEFMLSSLPDLENAGRFDSNDMRY
jgi:hypothetical protein